MQFQQHFTFIFDYQQGIGKIYDKRHFTYG